MTTPAIETFALAENYGTTRALLGLDLQVNEGEVVGCLGPNVAGKTTLNRLLLGLLIPSHGRAKVFGMDSQRDTVAAHRRLADAPGEANLWPTLSVAETLRLLGQVYGKVDLTYQAELAKW
jgi:ABC-2 type transport system ATP-binding protein